jgi:phosphatidylglycerophosphatase C
MPQPVIAVFDFDETLTTKHSLRPFLRYVVGTRGWLTGVFRSAPWLAGSGIHIVDRGTAKARLLRATIRGRTQSELKTKAEQFAKEWLPAMIRPELAARVHEHLRRGHELVLASASLDVYLRPWATRVGFCAVLATELEFVNERCTGRLATPNCWGEEKARRFQEWLATRPPSLIYAYGDNRGDREMLAMADRPWKRGDGALPPLDETQLGRVGEIG